MHLVVEIKNANNNKLKDTEVTFNYLDSIVEKIGMRKLSDPLVLSHYDTDHPRDGGVTGFVILSESHASVHTFDQRGAAYFDLFSCKEFNDELVREEIVKFYSKDSQLPTDKSVGL